MPQSSRPRVTTNARAGLHKYDVAGYTFMVHSLFHGMAPGVLGIDVEYDQIKNDDVGDTGAQNEVFVTGKGSEEKEHYKENDGYLNQAKVEFHVKGHYQLKEDYRVHCPGSAMHYAMTATDHVNDKKYERHDAYGNDDSTKGDLEDARRRWGPRAIGAQK